MDDLCRGIAVKIVSGTRPNEHEERLTRIHRFVRSLSYHREPCEMFQPVAQTLVEGGDCDDHVLAQAALAWALRYPFFVQPVGNELDPSHYTCQLGFPESEHPWGGPETTWRFSETTPIMTPKGERWAPFGASWDTV